MLRPDTRVREQVVNSTLVALGWQVLQPHLDEIGPSRGQLRHLCAHIRHRGDLVYKYPRADFESRRARFLARPQSYAAAHLSAEASDEVSRETDLIGQVEHGYCAASPTCSSVVRLLSMARWCESVRPSAAPKSAQPSCPLCQSLIHCTLGLNEAVTGCIF